MWLRRQRIPEEHDEIELMLDEHRADLRVAAEWAGEQERNLQAGVLGDECSGRPGGDKRTTGERIAIEFDPFGQICFACVVRDERDASVGAHRRTIPPIFSTCN